MTTNPFRRRHTDVPCHMRPRVTCVQESHASKSRVSPKTDRHDGRTYITLHRPRDRGYHSFFEIQHTILGKIGGRSKKWSACFELIRFMETDRLPVKSVPQYGDLKYGDLTPVR